LLGMWTKYYLDAKGLRLIREVPRDSTTVSYAGLSDGITFLSDPFEVETEITGPDHPAYRLLPIVPAKG
jgi:hypothetical protein